jgi:anti-anti-sigma factor
LAEGFGMSFKVEVEADVAVVTIDGEVTSSKSSELQTVITGILDDGTKAIIFDLEHLSYICSLGIGVLARACGELKKNNGKMVVFNASKEVHKLFKLLRLDRIIPIASSRSQAIELCL